MPYRGLSAVAMRSSRSIRMFVAVDVPEGVSSHIISSLEGIEELGARVVRKDDMHATLAFFGGVETEQQDLLCGIIDRVESRRFRIDLSGFGLLGRRIVYAKITEGADSLRTISSRLKAGARAAGIDADMKDFLPHVTIARIRNGREESVRKFIEGINDAGPWSFICTRISAKRSDFTKGRVEHTEVCLKELI